MAVAMDRRWLLKRPAFGLVEVLVATAIFVALLGGLVSLARLSNRNSIIASHRVQANYLALEGIEAVRQLRDQAWLERRPFDQWIIADCQGENLTQTSYAVPNGDEQESKTQQFALCYQESSERFGLLPLASDLELAEKQTTLNLGLDSEHPLPYRRIIELSRVKSPAGELAGLAILPPLSDQQTEPELKSLNPAEISRYAWQVRVLITWQEFGRPYQLEQQTLLTDWQST